MSQSKRSKSLREQSGNAWEKQMGRDVPGAGFPEGEPAGTAGNLGTTTERPDPSSRNAMSLPTAAPKPAKKNKSGKKKRNWLRAYGSPERVEWVKGCPCVVCGRRPSENAHIESGGKGRKADANKIVPLCGESFGPILGCHKSLHMLGRESFEKLMNVDLEKLAAQTDAAWCSHLNTMGK